MYEVISKPKLLSILETLTGMGCSRIIAEEGQLSSCVEDCHRVRCEILPHTNTSVNKGRYNICYVLYCFMVRH